jgi:translation initiation factor 1
MRMARSRLVYSTDGGRVLPAGAARPAVKAGDPAPPRTPDDGVVRIFRERSGRNGKTVTVVRGLPDRGAALEARAAELRRLCGAGGTTRDAAVEVQGDHRERIAERLRGLGYRVKLAGG